MQPFRHPNDASDKIWLQSASWSRRYSCLKVWTHVRTPARVPSYKLTLWAFGSGELKKKQIIFEDVRTGKTQNRSTQLQDLASQMKFFKLLEIQKKGNVELIRIHFYIK